jgi:hypothetical protein
MTMAQLAALTEVERANQKGEAPAQEGTPADWAMLSSLPMSG